MASAASLRTLETIFRGMNPPPSATQQCFLRAYVEREGITGLQPGGQRTAQEAERGYPFRVAGPILTGTNERGQPVRIVIGSPHIDRVHVQVGTENGRMEVFEIQRSRDRLRTTLIGDAFFLPPRNGFNPSGVDGRHFSETENGVALLNLPGIQMPPNDRHTDLNSYIGCGPLISSRDLLPRFTPT
jgi:hypothetical protein